MLDKKQVLADVIVTIIALALSFLVITGISCVVCSAIGVIWSWKIAFASWLLYLLLQGLFKR